MPQYLKKAVIVMLVLGAIGFIDATYLTITHFRGGIPPCTISGCEVVLTSDHNKIIGIPVALLGSLYYLTILSLAITSYITKKERTIKLLSFFTIIGFVASLFFVYLMLFVINALCQYCLISAISSTLLFVTGMYTITKMKRDESTQLTM